MPTVPSPTKNDISKFFSKLNECNTKAVALSLVEPYCKQFVSKSRNIPSHLNLSYPELLQKCGEIDMTISDADRSLIEMDTRDQANGTAFFSHRAGCIGASQSFVVAHQLDHAITVLNQINLLPTIIQIYQ